jgi:hypothetical protein
MTSVSEPAWATKAFDREKAAELSQDLHQAAQPLTVLQGCLELALTGAHTVDEYKRSIKRALDESRRVSACFDRIRQLVQTSTPTFEAGRLAASAKGSRTSPVSDAKRIRCVHV